MIISKHNSKNRTTSPGYKNYLLFSLIILLFFIAQTAAASNVSKKKNSKNATKIDIERIINETDPDVNIAVIVRNLDQNKLLYSLNENRYFVFGSAKKIFTLFTLFDYFGKDYEFKTSITREDNHVYLHINDPSLNSKDLLDLIVQMKESIGDKIEGNFVIADDEFTLPSMIRDKTIADNLYCYGAPISKVHVNKNCFRMQATPAGIGSKIKISQIEPILPYEIVNNAYTVPNHEWDRINTEINGDTIQISGSLSPATGKAFIAVTSMNGSENVKRVIEELLKRQAISVEGDILVTKRSRKGEVVAEITKPIKEIIASTLKKSDNFMTDYMLAIFATDKGDNEWRKATRDLKQLIKSKYGVNVDDTNFVDGSGLSRTSLEKPKHYDNFLQKIAKLDNFKDKLDLLAKPKEGTMNGRFEQSDKIFAKTGYLMHNASIVGYFYDDNNELNSFVIVINNYYGDKSKYLQLSEKIVKYFMAKPAPVSK